MVFGLQFTNDSKQKVELAIDVATLQLKYRVNSGSGWSAWKRADVDRNVDGSIASTVAHASRAGRADTADAFTTPVTVTFTGGASGTMVLDGSRNKMDVALALGDFMAGNNSVGAAVQQAISAKMDQHIQSHHTWISEP